MTVSGPNKYVRLFIKDIAASGGTVKGFIERYNGSKMMRLLIDTLYPNISIQVGR